MLTLCPACERHHFAETACPFCAQSKTKTVRTAVAVAAGIVALGSFGCAYGSPAPICPTDGSPRDPECEPLDAGTSDASASDAKSDAP
jgi:hypothetical protein